MILRIITGICGVAIIALGFMVKRDTAGKYSTSLKEKYTEESVKVYLKNSFNSEMFFGGGMIIEAIFGEGPGYWIGWFISLLGVILLFVYMKKLKKKNTPYVNKYKK